MACSSVGAVVIGRNEGELLRKCLASVLPQATRTVYVDSGSTDGSIELAAEMGAEVIELDRELPFTAARARNVGWRRLMQLDELIQYVQFVDGDCTVEDSWIEHAANELGTHNDTAIVLGHVREADSDRNIYHRLAAIEWDTPTGEVPYCGGIAVVSLKALKNANGYRDELAAGEEPELCVRLRQAGWKVRKLDKEMAIHDIDTNSLLDWWRRTVRSGRAYAEGAFLHGKSSARHWVRESRSIWMWGAVAPFAALALAWPTHGISIGIAIVCYLLLFARILLNRRRTKREPFSSSLLYAGMCVAVKWPQAVGQLSFLATRSRYPRSSRSAKALIDREY